MIQVLECCPGPDASITGCGRCVENGGGMTTEVQLDLTELTYDPARGFCFSPEAIGMTCIRSMDCLADTDAYGEPLTPTGVQFLLSHDDPSSTDICLRAYVVGGVEVTDPGILPIAWFRFYGLR